MAIVFYKDLTRNPVMLLYVRMTDHRPRINIVDVTDQLAPISVRNSSREIPGRYSNIVHKFQAKKQKQQRKAKKLKAKRKRQKGKVFFCFAECSLFIKYHSK